MVSHCKDKFKQFINTFVDQEIARDERFPDLNPDEPFYLQRLEEVVFNMYLFRTLGTTIKK